MHAKLCQHDPATFWMSACVFLQSSQIARVFSSGPAQLKSSLILFLPMTGVSRSSVWQQHCGAVLRPPWYVAALCGQVTAYLQNFINKGFWSIMLRYYLKSGEDRLGPTQHFAWDGNHSCIETVVLIGCTW